MGKPPARVKGGAGQMRRFWGAGALDRPGCRDHFILARSLRFAGFRPPGRGANERL